MELNFEQEKAPQAESCSSLEENIEIIDIDTLDLKFVVGGCQDWFLVAT